MSEGKVNTYHEMNETVKDLLRRSEEPMNLYILARIEELESMNAEMLEAWKGVCEACGFNDTCEANYGCEYAGCAGHKWRSFWKKEELELGEIIVTKQWASDGWVRGRIGKYSFSAKVYGAPSAQYGIDKGRVSKLSIREEAGKRPVVNYDRGWDIRPEGKRVEKIFRKILAFLEAIPLPGSEDK